MFKFVLIGCLIVGSAMAEKNDTAVKEKRQTEHETRALPSDRRQHPDYFHQQAQSQQIPDFYGQQRQYVLKPQSIKGGQEQIQEIPQEYLGLIQQLSYKQAHLGEQQKPHPSNKQASIPRPGKHPHQYSVPKEVEQQSQQQQQQQFVFQPQNNAQYITEEEYAELLKRQQQPPAAYHKQQQPPQGHQYSPQASNKNAYNIGSESPKYRPQVQYINRPPPQHPANDAYAQIETLPESVKLQYKSLQTAGTVSAVPRPINHFSFEKELAQLVESNKPVQFQQHQQGPNFAGAPQTHEYQFVSANQEFAPKQQSKQQYVAPFLNPQYSQKQQQAPKAQQKHQASQKYESPAQKYQFISTENPFKGQDQQYFSEVSPKFSYTPEKQSGGTPSPKIQYYLPKEKNVQIYYPHQTERQQAEQQPQQHPMKIVEAPQLQHEKPQQRFSQAYRQQKAQNAAALKQAEQNEAQQSIHKSKEVDLDGPSRSSIYVSQQTGIPAPSERQPQNPNANKIPPKSDRPLTQEEFQALVDAGYSVVPIPVPVPVPQYTQNHQHPQVQQQNSRSPVPRYHQQQQQQQAAENNPNAVITYLRPLQLDPYSGVRGPNKSSA